MTRTSLLKSQPLASSDTASSDQGLAIAHEPQAATDTRHFHFVEPLPDETVYSMLARYDALTRGSRRPRISEIYVRPHEEGLLPSALFRFYSSIDRLKHSSFAAFLDQHTLLPLFKPFVAPELEDWLRDENRTMLSNTLKGRGAKAKHGRFMCPTCREEDMETYGQPYWHRRHQAPGAYFCCRHDQRLISRCDSCGLTMGSSVGFSLPPSHCSCGWQLQSERNSNFVEGALGKLTAVTDEVISASMASIDPVAVRLTYRQKMREAGYDIGANLTATSPESLRFWHDMQEFYGPGVLDDWDLGAGNTSEPAWLKQLRRTSIVSRGFVLQHQVIIAFLFESYAEFCNALEACQHNLELDKESLPKIRPYSRSIGTWRRGNPANWTARDLAVSKKIEEAVRAKRQFGGLPEPLSASSLLRKVGSSRHQYDAERMPLTKAALAANTAVGDALFRSRIKWAIEQTLSEGKPIVKSEIARRANITNHYHLLEEFF